MANEAVLKLRQLDPIDFIIGNNAAIEKGTLMAFFAVSNERTVSGNEGCGGQAFAGIAAREKIAGDGRTRLAVYRTGVFDIKLATNSTCSGGDLVILSGTNTIARAKDFPDFATSYQLFLSGMIVGQALESGISAEVIEVDIGRTG